MTAPVEDVRDISRIAYGFLGSKALFAALHLDLFSVIEARPLTARELGEATGVAQHRMQRCSRRWRASDWSCRKRPLDQRAR